MDEELEVPEPDFWQVVNTLYCGFKTKNPQIRGGDFYHCGEVQECPLDLCIACEIAARRVLTIREYALWLRFSLHSAEAANRLLPAAAKKKLAEAFKAIYYDFVKLRRASEHASALQRAKEQRQATLKEKAAQALDSGFSGYTEDEVQESEREAQKQAEELLSQ